LSDLVLSPWQPAWPQQAAQVAAELQAFWPQARIEPIGSTAVPGLCAKPVLDLMLGVADLAELDPARLPGWRYRPEHEAELPERRYFTRDAAGELPRVHLHGLRLGGLHWRRHLLLRDRLRADPALREAYAALKTRLAQQHATDKAAYQAAKAPFILETLQCPDPPTTAR
jgi:GrpB-like predicted nucleotidyltransferase (UPF0157 family)